MEWQNWYKLGRIVFVCFANMVVIGLFALVFKFDCHILKKFKRLANLIGKIYQNMVGLRLV